MAHRGPDGAGVWTAPGVGLGHRRLSIIDIAGSPQPMASTDGAAMLVFNGEIYNYRELREELKGAGAEFHTDGDSEVILAAWQRWGPDCVTRLHGMFAFAIYDQRERTLFLARDRLGVKPLFYAPLSDGSLAFASELKGLLAHPLLRREIDPLAIEDYLAWGYVPDHCPQGTRCCCATTRRCRRHRSTGTSASPNAATAAPPTLRPSCCT
jgi:asparagine synthase (glutamine-hydrolysing)